MPKFTCFPVFLPCGSVAQPLFVLDVRSAQKSKAEFATEAHGITRKKQIHGNGESGRIRGVSSLQSINTWPQPVLRMPKFTCFPVFLPCGSVCFLCSIGFRVL